MEKGLTMSTKLSLYFKIPHKVFIVIGFVIVYHLCAHMYFAHANFSFSLYIK